MNYCIFQRISHNLYNLIQICNVFLVSGKQRLTQISSLSCVYLKAVIACLSTVPGIDTEQISFEGLVLYYTPQWYHDFEELGIKTYPFPGEGYEDAQRIKKYKLFEYIEEAIAAGTQDTISVAELFCADGFYANYAALLGATNVVGIDLCGGSGEGTVRSRVLDQARLITKLLGNDDKVSFVQDDVFHLSSAFDIILCIGGLYHHLDDPERLLRLLLNKTQQVLIIQTVVTIETEDPEYFVSPCPGWTWGSRFTHAWLVNALSRNGWQIVHEYRNELTYNERACDRGSSYIYCIPDEQVAL